VNRFVGIAQARDMRGLRLGCLRGLPSPWTEAAKGIFHAKGLACQYAARAADEPPDALAAWSGDRGVPLVAYENEPLRTGWAEILILAERLAPTPPLLPQDAGMRALAFGLAHEICGEMGLGWSYRLVMIQGALGHGREGGLSPAVAGYLAPRYGFNPVHVRAARERVIDVLAMLSRRIEGRTYFIEDTLSAVDIYWATFANMLTPLSVADLPFEGSFRAAYTCADEAILGAISPALRAHQENVYRRHLELPVPL
jgi:glutathione S-transferase